MLKEKNIWFQYGSLGGRFPTSFFTSHWPVAQTKQHLNAREVMDMFRLAPGEYLIVPSTFRPDETASFMLRILSKSETHAQYAHALHSHHHLVFHNAYICKCCKCFYYLFLFLFFSSDHSGQSHSPTEKVCRLRSYNVIHVFFPLNMAHFVLITSQPLMREINQNDEDSRTFFKDYSDQVFCLTQTLLNFLTEWSTQWF